MTIGVVYCDESSPIVSIIFPGVAPADKARMPAAWITGPSATGSENGMPTSRISAPPSINDTAFAKNAFGSGSLPMRYATITPSARLPSSRNFCPIASSLRKLSCNRVHVLVSSTRQVYDDRLITSELLRQFCRVTDCVSRFERRHYSLQLRQSFEGVHRVRVSLGNVRCPSYAHQIGVLWPNSWIVKPCRDALRGLNLTLRIL